MILGKIEREEVVPFRLDLGADRAREPELMEDLADFIHDLRDQVESATPRGPARHREVDAGYARGRAFQLALARIDGGLELALQRVRRQIGRASCRERV